MADQPEEIKTKPDDREPALDRLRDEITAIDGVLRRLAEEARTLAARLLPHTKLDLESPHGWLELSDAVARLLHSPSTDQAALLHLQSRVAAWQRAQRRLIFLCGTRAVWNT